MTLKEAAIQYFVFPVCLFLYSFLLLQFEDKSWHTHLSLYYVLSAALEFR